MDWVFKGGDQVKTYFLGRCVVLVVVVVVVVVVFFNGFSAALSDVMVEGLQMESHLGLGWI